MGDGEIRNREMRRSAAAQCGGKNARQLPDGDTWAKMLAGKKRRPA